MAKQTHLLLIAIPAAVLVLLVGAFAGDQLITGGEVARNVTAAGVELGGLGEEDAMAAMHAYEARLLSRAPFTVKGTPFDLDPATVGIDIDEEAIVAAAFEQRRDVGLLGRFFGWFGSFGDSREVDVDVAVDEDAIDDVLREWEATAIADPAYDGGILIVDGRALPDYPREGEGIDRASAVPLTVASLRSVERSTVDLPTTILQPQLTAADVESAAEEAQQLIGEAVTLSSSDPEVNIVFESADLAGAFISEVVEESPPRITVGFDPDEIERLLAPHRSSIEQPARDARFTINSDDTVTLVPGRPQTLLDVELVVDTLEDVAKTAEASGEFPFAFGRQPSFTTEEAEAMGPITLEGSFTTEHPAGQPRVTNIHLIADAVNGAVVPPGATFSLNDHVGPRTTEKGYVPAPMILAGELVDSVGGGVSQFATTFYNAVFYGCYEDVEHKPHSYYFSRYPEVNEATISWPQPDLVFRNNTDAMVIIKTQYTSTSITVKLFGNNDGKKCERRLGERTSYRDPPTEYEADASLDPTQEVVAQSGASGWSNSVVRVITHSDGTVEEETWTWAYSPQPRLVRVHPCNMPGSGEQCPVLVPSVVGKSRSDATATLQEAGFTVAVGASVETSDPALDGTVAAQSTTGYLAVGSTVTIDVYTYVEPPPTTTRPPPPPEDPGG
jgi:vancomycin resistance protein YoaR